MASDNATSSTLSLKWDEPNPRNGKILKYTVYYLDSGSAIGPDAFQEVPIEFWPSKNTTEDKSKIILDKLKADNKYNISIKAYTSIGSGNYSTPKQFQTVPGSKLHY